MRNREHNHPLGLMSLKKLFLVNLKGWFSKRKREKMQGGSYWTGAQRREARSILAFFAAGATFHINWPEKA
jgi:hypothetical protein